MTIKDWSDIRSQRFTPEELRQIDQEVEHEMLALTPELKELLEARHREAQADPEAGIPWEDVKARLLKRA
jgi:putative addiction module component (TIGR02574 family)